MIRVCPPTAGKSEADVLLALALQLQESDKCPGGCGGYLDETSADDGMHVIETVTCDACRTRDEHCEQQAKQQPGELVGVVRDPDAAE